jgi:glycosyltransferase involved in cell wall biosynthesis
MKMLINTASTLKGGGIQVAISFLEDCKEHTENEYHVILGAALARLINQQTFPENFTFYTIGYRPATRVFSLQSHDHFFKNVEKKVQPDVVFTTTGPSYWRPSSPHVMGYNLGDYIYTESPYFKLISPYIKLRWNLKRKLIRFFYMKDADAVVVQTDDVKERVMRFLKKDKVFTVSNTYSSYYNHPARFAAKLPPKKEGEFRLLTLSAWYLHKNLRIIPKVIDSFSAEDKSKIKFVLTLPKEIFEKEIPSNYRQYCYNTGAVKIEESPSLYQECDAMFLPTLLECFSASYAEAMVMNKPILTSDMSFATTVCDDAAMYFNPVDAKDIAAKILTLINDQALQQTLIAKGKKRMSYFGTSQQRTAQFLKICAAMAK